MSTELSATQLLLAMFGQTTILLGACGAVIKILAKRQDRPAAIAPAILPTNGATREVLETKIQAIKDLLERDLAEHERRITRHKEEITDLWGTFDKRLSAQNNRVGELEKWRAVKDQS